MISRDQLSMAMTSYSYCFHKVKKYNLPQDKYSILSILP